MTIEQSPVHLLTLEYISALPDPDGLWYWFHESENAVWQTYLKTDYSTALEMVRHYINTAHPFARKHQDYPLWHFFTVQTDILAKEIEKAKRVDPELAVELSDWMRLRIGEDRFTLQVVAYNESIIQV